MSPNELIPAEPVKHRGDPGLSKLHHPPGRAAHHTAPPQPHAAESAQTIRLLDVPLDRSRSLETGLKLLGKKIAEETAQAKEPKLYERFRQAHDQHPEVFETAFKDLQAGRASLSGADFYDHVYRGLEIISLHDPALSALAPADRIAALLYPPEGRAASSPENIVRIFRIGETSARGRALRPGAALFLEIYLAQRWGQKHDGMTVTGQVVNNRDLDCFLAAAELLIGLYDKIEERIKRGSEEKRAARDTATKRLAEKKAEAEKAERLRFLAAEERIAEERAGLGAKDAPLVKLGRAILSARADLGQTVLGLSQFGSLGEFLDKSMQMSSSEVVIMIAHAYRWGRLSDLLAGLPVELQDNIRALLLAPDIPKAKTDEAIAFLTDPPRRELLELGYQFLSSDPKLLANCFDLDNPLERLASHGEYGRQVRQALDTGDTAKLIPALILCAGSPLSPDLTKKYVIGHILRTAEPRDIPVLIEAGDAVLAKLPRQQQPLRAAVAWLIAETVQLLCRDQQAVEILLQEAPPAVTRETNLVELRPVRQVTKQFVLNVMVASAHRPPSDNLPAWPQYFGQATRQVASANGAVSGRRDFQRQVVSLAARLASVRVLIDSRKPAEAREELHRALDEAEKKELKLTRAPFLIGSVYAGVLEKVMAGELKELPALLSDPESPGLSLSAVNVSAVLAGEIYTALSKTPGVSDDLVAEELLLHGLITDRVRHEREAVQAIVSLLKGRRVWNQLLITIRQEPGEVIGFIDRLLETAAELRVAERTVGKFRRIILWPAHHPQVLHEALTQLTNAPPDPLAQTG